MLDQKIRVLWDRALRPVGGSLARSGLSANAVTVLGLLIQIGVAALIVDGRLLAAGLASIAGGLSDALDGAIAKAKGTANRLGAFYDSATDRLSDALYFVPLAWLYGVSPDVPERRSIWVAALALITLVASFLVSYVRARAEGLGFDAKVGIAERAERVIVIVIGLVFDVVLAALWILSVASVITLIQRIVHVRRQARA